jgi:hypothetical protein
MNQIGGQGNAILTVTKVGGRYILSVLAFTATYAEKDTCNCHSREAADV